MRLVRALISLVLAVPMVFAVGTCTTARPVPNIPQFIANQGASVSQFQQASWQVTCVGDPSTGSFPSVSVAPALAGLAQMTGFYPYRIEVIPGSTQPTSNSSITFLNVNSVDELGGAGLGAIQAATQISLTMQAPSGLTGSETINITGNSVASANIVIQVYAASTAINPGLPTFTSARELTQPYNDGAYIVEKGPRWYVANYPAAGTAAVASKAAGGASVRHVADCITFSSGATTATTATSTNVSLLDGSNVLATWYIYIPSSTGQITAPFGLCGLNLPGSLNSTMSLSWAAGVSNLAETASITGYDVQ